jgi:hypothetical protein
MDRIEPPEEDPRIAERWESLRKTLNEGRDALLRTFDACAKSLDAPAGEGVDHRPFALLDRTLPEPEIRLRKLQADLSNVDASTDQRLMALEHRMLEIELRLHIPPPPAA